MLIDTHCHLNFQAFDGKTGQIVSNAKEAGVDFIIVPGTDYATSEKAVALAGSHPGVYAAVAIHPHHIFEMMERKDIINIISELTGISKLLKDDKVVAIGEAGMDRHMYKKTKYPDYRVEQEFISLQADFLRAQIALAADSNKALILHNREAKSDILKILDEVWDKRLEGKTVLHCCEPDPELLEYGKARRMFIGVDGDVVYYRQKQEFIKTVPLDMLVLETDSPFLSPFRKFPNEPRNISYIAEYLSKILKRDAEEIAVTTTDNAKRLFGI